MLDLGGGISLVEGADQTCKLVNRSALNLHGVGLLRKTGFGELEAAWIGEVPAAATGGMGTSVVTDSTAAAGIPVHWNTLDAADLRQAALARPARGVAAERVARRPRDTEPSRSARSRPGRADARRRRGSVDRLVDDDLPGLTIKPAAPQVRRGIVGHRPPRLWLRQTAAAGYRICQAR